MSCWTVLAEHVQTSCSHDWAGGSGSEERACNARRLPACAWTFLEAECSSSHRISQVGVEHWPVLCQAYVVRTDSPRCRRRRRSATLYLIMSA